MDDQIIEGAWEKYSDAQIAFGNHKKIFIDGYKAGMEHESSTHEKNTHEE